MTTPPALPATMRAWAVRAYGGPQVLALVQRPVPLPGPGDVLIRVQATTVSAGDRRLRSLDFPAGLKLVGRLAVGLRKPRRDVLGTEVAGTIAAVGPQVTGFAVGDPVIAYPGVSLGGHAEFVRIPASGRLVAWPAGLGLEVAAALGFGGMTARDFLRRAALQAGERLLVIGAAGAVGSALVQLAVDAGAVVTGVTSTGNLDLVRSLGASEVVDYTQTDIRQLGQRFEIIAECVGATTFLQGLPLLVPGGRFLAIAGGLGDMVRRSKDGRRCIAGPAAERADDLAALVALAASGRFRPVIDRVLPFEALPEAHARADTGRKRGSVVVTVHPPG